MKNVTVMELPAALDALLGMPALGLVADVLGFVLAWFDAGLFLACRVTTSRTMARMA